MVARQIIAPHSHPFAPFKAHQPEWMFKEKEYLPVSTLSPSRYTLHTHKSGQVDLIEYASVADYLQHRNRIVAALGRKHERTGKRVGCMCSHCR